jgi:hypothetical protein
MESRKGMRDWTKERLILRRLMRTVQQAQHPYIWQVLVVMTNADKGIVEVINKG